MKYTEPDPREDLSGIDVARKVLILGRLAGWPLELSNLHVDPLYPSDMAELSAADFMATLPRLDADFAAYMGALVGVPRYMAEIKPSGGDVSLRMVGERLAAQLRGPLNQVSFWTARYSELPLSLSGPGGGMQVTGAAVLEDCLQLAQRL
jgi:aspartokinase/homoserine dehydrogenase 1